MKSSNPTYFDIFYSNLHILHRIIHLNISLFILPMQMVLIIGTVHTMMPEHQQELENLLRVINPDQILVEISPEDVQKENFKDYPKEMLFAYSWGKQFGKKVNGFDASLDIENATVSEEMKRQLGYEAGHLVAIINWKELNKTDTEIYRRLSLLTDRIIDKEKHAQRQEKMLENIEKQMIPRGKILILTGSFHLPFFQKRMKNALFPLSR